MPVQPSACFICKNKWQGAGPLCPDCLIKYQTTYPQFYAQYVAQYGHPKPTVSCSFCGSPNHDEQHCYAAALYGQSLAQGFHSQTQPGVAPNLSATHNMARRGTRTSRRGSSQPIYPNYRDAMPMTHCAKCRQRQRIETKAGSVCMSCQAVTHNPCRNCNSAATKGVTGDGLQFIECSDCLFIE